VRSGVTTIQPVEPESSRRGLDRIGRLLGWGVVLALVGAVAWAVVELFSGSISETDGRVILTSLGFAAASTTGASGLAAILRPSPALRVLGVATMGCSIAAFALLTAMIWHDDFPFEVRETLWRACGCASVLAIAGGHASLMLRGRRPTDSALVELVTIFSLLFGAVDAVGAFLWLAELVDEISDPWGRRLAAVLVLLIATTVLAPLLRRLQAAPAEAPEGTATAPAG
jgi:MFS family permease